MFFPDFKKAALHASHAAMQARTTIYVRRIGIGWIVVDGNERSPRYDDSQVGERRTYVHDNEDEWDQRDEEDQETSSLLSAEFEEDQECYARSDEEGWFYAD